MKQETMSDCVAAVAAMATGTTLEQVKAEIAECPEGGYSDLDFIAYCARHGVIAGGIAYAPDDELIADAVRDGYLKIYIHQPAYAGCKSERLNGKDHALYWDGQKIWDPNPNSPDGRPLSDYRITFWWPLFRSSDGAEALAKRLK